MKLIITIILVGLLAFSSMGAIISIGETRKPVTHGSALASLILNVLVILGILFISQ